MHIRFALLLSLLMTGLASAGEKVTLALNWVPEPEFGGMYAAAEDGDFAKHGLDVDISAGGAGAPTWQRVASGQVAFGVSSADEIVIARANGADVVAIFTVFQTCPQGIMVHASRGLTSIDQAFKSGTLAIEIGLPYGKFLQKKYGFDGVKRVPYDGGIAGFLADKNYAQQCFVTSEPLAAKDKGSDPQTFLIADSGYNPYTGVVCVSGDYLQKHRDTVHGMVDALAAGWRAYQDDPTKANVAMGKLNPAMDASTFAAAAAVQKALVEPKSGEKLGTMTKDRWQTLIDQLADLKQIRKSPKAEDCFVDLAKK